ncbi:MAG: hypothetical protein ACK5Z5_05515 [Neisseriaceae bacterium]
MQANKIHTHLASAAHSNPQPVTPAIKNQIIKNIYLKIESKSLDKYDDLLNLAKDSLETLSEYRGGYKKTFSNYFHVGMTSSVQELFVILIMVKNNYDNVSQITGDNVYLVMRDLIEDQTNLKSIQYDSSKDYIFQIIAEVVPNPRFRGNTECIKSGIELFENKNASSITKNAFMPNVNVTQNGQTANCNTDNAIVELD